MRPNGGFPRFPAQAVSVSQKEKVTVTDAGWGGQILSDGLRMEWEGEIHLAQELRVFHSPKRLNFSSSEVSPRVLSAGWAPWRRKQGDRAGAGTAGAEGGRAGRRTP